MNPWLFFAALNATIAIGFGIGFRSVWTAVPNGIMACVFCVLALL